MKEAYLYKSPVVYAVMRRLELLRWAFRDKIWHKDASRLARVRALILFLCGHETEVCCICGDQVGLVWWCEDKALWTRLTGWDDGGVTCIKCFDRLAERAHVLLRWLATVDESPSVASRVRPLPVSGDGHAKRRPGVGY